MLTKGIFTKVFKLTWIAQMNIILDTFNLASLESAREITEQPDYKMNVYNNIYLKS